MRSRLVLAAIAAAFSIVALRAHTAAAGGCRGYLDVKAGPGGTTATNAGILLMGYTFDDPKPTVTLHGKATATASGRGGCGRGRRAARYFPGPPARGSWPKSPPLPADPGA